jgi:hypothetical protein
MDHFEETDEKLITEINLSSEAVESLMQMSISGGYQKGDSNETIENLLQNNNTKLVLQSKNPYSKLAFIKALKDNLVNLGYLEENTDTLSYFQEDLVSSTAMTSSSAPKKRKVLSRKKSHDKTNIFGDRTNEILEVKIKKL